MREFEQFVSVDVVQKGSVTAARLCSLFFASLFNHGTGIDLLTMQEIDSGTFFFFFFFFLVFFFFHAVLILLLSFYFSSFHVPSLVCVGVTLPRLTPPPHS